MVLIVRWTYESGQHYAFNTAWNELKSKEYLFIHVYPGEKGRFVFQHELRPDNSGWDGAYLMFGVRYSISVENQPYPVLCTITADGCTAHVPDFPKIAVHTPTLDAALLEVKQQIQKVLHQYKYPPIPTKQEEIVVLDNSVLVLVKAV